MNLKLSISGFQGTDNIILNDLDTTKANYIDLIDYYGNVFQLKIHTDANIYGSKVFILYTNCAICNQIPFDLYYFYRNSQTENIVYSPGQKVKNIPSTQYSTQQGKMSLFACRSNLYVCSNENGTNLSKNININGIGIDVMDIYLSELSLIETHIEVCLLEVDKEMKLFTKIINLMPKYILVNSTQYQMQVRQENIYNEAMLINTNERIPFIWSDRNK